MKALIVEDELIIASDLKLQIGFLGFTSITIASNYQIALSALDNTNPDVIFMDINLKGEKTGIDLAKEIRRLNIQAPIIFSTAFSNSILLEEIKSVENSFYVKKPFSYESLGKVIKEVFRKT